MKLLSKAVTLNKPLQYVRTVLVSTSTVMHSSKQREPQAK